MILRGLRGGAKGSKGKAPVKKKEEAEDGDDLQGALVDPLAPTAGAGLMDWAKAKEKKRRGIKFDDGEAEAEEGGEENLSDMDDDELDE